jgi:hypothetical protein
MEKLEMRGHYSIHEGNICAELHIKIDPKEVRLSECCGWTVVNMVTKEPSGVTKK